MEKQSTKRICGNEDTNQTPMEDDYGTNQRYLCLWMYEQLPKRFWSHTWYCKKTFYHWNREWIKYCTSKVHVNETKDGWEIFICTWVGSSLSDSRRATWRIFFWELQLIDNAECFDSQRETNLWGCQNGYEAVIVIVFNNVPPENNWAIEWLGPWWLGSLCHWWYLCYLDNLSYVLMTRGLIRICTKEMCKRLGIQMGIHVMLDWNQNELCVPTLSETRVDTMKRNLVVIAPRDCTVNSVRCELSNNLGEYEQIKWTSFVCTLEYYSIWSVLRSRECTCGSTRTVRVRTSWNRVIIDHTCMCPRWSVSLLNIRTQATCTGSRIRILRMTAEENSVMTSTIDENTKTCLLREICRDVTNCIHCSTETLLLTF